MNEYLEEFIEFFNLGGLLEGGLTVSEFLGLSIVCFMGMIFCLIGVRSIFELVKILTDWSRFR